MIWQGSLHDWGKELEKVDPPEWANYAHRHEKAHGHQIMVEYPTRTVPFKLAKAELYHIPTRTAILIDERLEGL